jgi:hypothetical protein
MKYFFVLLLVVALIILGPLATIWALNTLFPALNIGYGLNEWIAVIILAGVIRGEITVNGK